MKSDAQIESVRAYTEAVESLNLIVSPARQNYDDAIKGYSIAYEDALNNLAPAARKVLIDIMTEAESRTNISLFTHLKRDHFLLLEGIFKQALIAFTHNTNENYNAIDIITSSLRKTTEKFVLDHPDYQGSWRLTPWLPNS